jgi:hypothetical protein
MMASRNKLLYTRIRANGKEIIKFSRTLILIFDLFPKVASKKSDLLFSESLS